MTTRKLLDKLLGSKILWVVVSILAAMVLWVYVTLNEQTETSIPLPNVQIEFIGEEALRDKGFLVTDIETTSVNLTIHGSKRALSQMSGANVTAQIDVSSYSRANAMTRGYELIYPRGVDRSEITLVEKSVEYIAFTIDQLDSKMVEVRVKTVGTINAEYISGEATAEPRTVRLIGASKELGDVHHALVTLEYNDLSHSIEGDYSYVLMDNNGNPLEYYGEGAEPEFSYKTIQREQDSVFVRLPIQMMKEIELAVEFVEGGGVTGPNAETLISPATVKVAGEPDVIRTLNKIVIGKVDLSSFATTFEATYDIKYPNDVEPISGQTEAQVKITITGVQSREITTNNITVSNVPEGFEEVLVTESLKITVRGPQSIIPMIQPENIRVVADYTAGEANTAGTSSLPAQVFIDGYPQAGAVGSYRVVVTIREKTVAIEQEPE